MDNKALADFIRLELAKVVSAIGKLTTNVSALSSNPRKQVPDSTSPEQAPANKTDSARIVGIPAKPNAKSAMIPNGIPG